MSATPPRGPTASGAPAAAAAPAAPAAAPSTRRPVAASTRRTPVTPAPAPTRTPWTRRTIPATTLVAGLALVATGMSFPISQGVTLGTLAGLALVPVWWASTRLYHDVRLLLLASGIAVVMGVWLAQVAAVDHATPLRGALSGILLLLNVVVGVMVVVWARTRMTDPMVAILYGVGMVLGIDRGGRFAENPWRFGFSIPLIVLLLGLAWLSGKGWLQLLTTIALAGMSAASGGRSTAAMLVLAAVVTLFQTVWGRSSNRRISRLRAVALIGALGVALYYVGQAAILDGYLGQDAQERTEAQIATSGSLVAGARPEFGATFAMVQDRPYGYGVGVLPNTQDLLVAKAGMAELRYDPDNGYVEKYMFGDGIELHSTTADLWAEFGLAGVAVAVLLLWIVVRGYLYAFSIHAASALLTYLTARTIWNLLFSPLSSSVVLLVIAVGLLAVRRAHLPGQAAPPVAAALPHTRLG